MRPNFIITAAAAGFVALSSLTGPTWALANRTFVSGQGSDSNPCSLPAPCRSFQHAHDLTNAGGEITVLDSAGYGTVAIGKSITITNPGGVEAGITATAGQTAIVIGPTSSIVVTLRGLTLEGGGAGQNGIVLEPTAPGTLNVIDCVVKDFVGIGIAITPSFSSLGSENVLIANSFVLNNAGSGIEIFPQSGSTRAIYAIDHTTVAGNGTSGDDAGILVNQSAGILSGTISSVHAHQNHFGVNFIGNELLIAAATVKNSVLTLNATDLSYTSSGAALSIRF